MMKAWQLLFAFSAGLSAADEKWMTSAVWVLLMLSAVAVERYKVRMER